MISFTVVPEWAPAEVMFVQWEDGKLTGDSMAIAWVDYRAAQGHEVEATATGPMVPVGRADPVSVLGALKELGRTDYEGDWPPWPWDEETADDGSPIIY